MIGMTVADWFDAAPITMDEAPRAARAPQRRAPKPKGETVLRGVRPNLGIAAAYRKRLLALIDEMNDSAVYWLTAAYRGNPPEMAQDELSSSALKAAIKKLVSRWYARFDTAAEELAKYFAQAVGKRSDAALKKILKDGGFAVDFKLTAAQRDVVNAIVNENVSLIKSIPREYLTQVEGAVMRSVQTGRDLGSLTDYLVKQHGVTRRRAAMIARDQNNRATGALTRVRQMELAGPDAEAIWVHAGGGKTARPTHLAAGRERVRYKVKEGWRDPEDGQFILPGQKINCRCIGRLVVKGFS